MCKFLENLSVRIHPITSRKVFIFNVIALLIFAVLFGIFYVEYVKNILHNFARYLLIFSLMFMGILSCLQYWSKVLKPSPLLSETRKKCAYSFSTVILIVTVVFVVITLNDSSCLFESTKATFPKYIWMVFPYWKNVLVVGLALLFWWLDWAISPVLTNSHEQITFDLTVLCTLILSSVFISLFLDLESAGEPVETIAVSYNSGVIAFHVILATLLFNTSPFSPEEAAYIELRLKLSDGLKEQRQQHNLTQVELAKRVKSSQSQIAKMEAGDPSISLDLLIRSLLALGVSNQDLARIISPSHHTTPP